jgi:hypothetical protein
VLNQSLRPLAPLESAKFGYLRHACDLWIYEEIREAFLSGTGRDLPAAELVAIHGPAAVPGAHVQIEAMAAEE